MPKLDEQKVKKLGRVLLKKYNRPKKRSDYGWGTAPFNVIDCVLSLHQNYEKTVKPRLEMFVNEYPRLKTLKALKKIILDDYNTPYQFLKQELDYKSKTKAKVLLNVIDYLIEIQNEYKGRSEEQRLYNWAVSVSIRDHITIGVKNFGIAGFQYMRMLCGAQTVKPDVHIIGFVSKTIDERVTGYRSVLYMEAAAKLHKLNVREIDNKIFYELSG